MSLPETPNHEDAGSLLTDLVKLLAKLAMHSIGDSRIGDLAASVVEDFLDAYYDAECDPDSEDSSEDDGPPFKKLKTSE